MANLFRCIGGSQSPIPIGTKYEYAYTGKVEQFIVQFSGLYRFECFGASGGNAGGYSGGLGGYSSGYKYLKKGEVLYICVGGNGTEAPYDSSSSGGYNGGANGYSGTYGNQASGGGATHIAKQYGQLKEFTYDNFVTGGLGLIVAGGGGGASSYRTHNGGSGGGLEGGTGGLHVATQTSGQNFGYATSHKNGGAGGGGGLYGGYNSTESEGGGGGGSGYIGGVPSVIYKGVNYSPHTINGDNSGNGKAIITFINA